MWFLELEFKTGYQLLKDLKNPNKPRPKNPKKELVTSYAQAYFDSEAHQHPQVK